jgi:short-subunit dehydrogenase
MTDLPQKRFTDRVVVVTGASSGVGLAASHGFAREGAKVVLAARQPDRLRQAAKDLQETFGDRIRTIPCDVTKRHQVDDLIEKTLSQFGRIDILVNNAGSGLIAPVERVRIEDARALFDTNFFGALHGCQAVLPCMLRQQGGTIVNVASVAGLCGIPNSAVYSASKAALIALSDALRIEVSQFGIAVVVICPARISDTAFFASAVTYGPLKLYEVPTTLTAGTVAGAILDAAAARKRMVVLPFHARLMHIVNKFAPRLIDLILYRSMPRLEKTPSPQVP